MFLRRLPRFEHHSPASLPEALDLLRQYAQKAEVYAGGTDLLVAMKKREKAPQHLIDLKEIEEMKGIHADGNDGIRIGALTTLAELERSALVKEDLSPLWDAVNVMASPQIRTLGTIGGNLCSAMPSADTAPPLLALGASVRITGPRGERTLPVEYFFRGPGESDLKPGEILSQILIPRISAKTGGVYLKLMRRSAMDLAQVGVAVHIASDPAEKKICRKARIAFGAVARTPIRILKAEGILLNKEITQDLAREAGETASLEANPRSSIRASREYREAMIEVLTERAVMEALRRLTDRTA
jgi:CO/xanthine dehydrogenase FAD-binding subunit